MHYDITDQGFLCLSGSGYNQSKRSNEINKSNQGHRYFNFMFAGNVRTCYNTPCYIGKGVKYSKQDQKPCGIVILPPRDIIKEKKSWERKTI